jgi:hypothetical protein
MNSKLSPEVFEEKRKQCVKVLEEMAGIPFTPGKTNQYLWLLRNRTQPNR